MHPSKNTGQPDLLINIATRNVISLSGHSSIGEAAAAMAGKRISSIVVTDGRAHPLGIVTERDIVQAMQSGIAQTTPLTDIMSAPAISVPDTIRCSDAYQFCLDKEIRHLAIVNADNELVGVISETDFRVRIDLSALAGLRKVGTVSRNTVVALPPSAPLQQALDAMLEQRITCAVVVQEHKPIGIVTERDIVRMYAQPHQGPDLNLGQAMAAPVLTLSETAPISRAAEMMLTHKVRHLVVVDEQGRMTGLVDEHDLTKFMNPDVPDGREAVDSYFLNALINTLPDAVWLKDLNGVYIACNRRFEEFMGATKSAIVGKSDFALMSQEQADVFRSFDHKALELDGPSVNEEWITFANDGHRELVETIKTPMRGKGGKLIGVLGIARSITQRVQAEAALRESEQKYRALFETAGDGIFLQDENGLIDCNEKGAHMLGLTKQRLLGRSPYELAPLLQPNGRSSLAVAEEVIEAAFLGKPQQFEWSAMHADGTVIETEVSLNPVYYNDRRCLQSSVRDITERKRAEEHLRQQKQFSDAVISSLPGIFYILNSKGQFVQVNADFRAVTGYSNLEIMSMTALDIFDGANKTIIADRIARVFDSGSSNAEADLTTKDGRTLPYYFSGHLAQFENHPYLIGLGIDISERRRAEENLQVTASVFHNSHEAILITSADNTIVDVNPAFTQITGYRKDEVIGLNPRVLSSGRHNRAFYSDLWNSVTEKGAWRGEIWNRRRNGEIYAELLSISAIHDNFGRRIRHVGVFSDISHLKAHEEKLTRIAYHDALTGLPNRALLADRMNQAMSLSKRDGGIVAVCFVDLDGFKQINDTYGHSAGDQVLIDVARRMSAVVRGGDTVARLGGDEFAVLLLGMHDAAESRVTLERLLAAIALPWRIDDQQVFIGASIGVCIYPQTDADSETLLNHADEAMYTAKKSGKNRFHFY